MYSILIINWYFEVCVNRYLGHIMLYTYMIDSNGYIIRYSHIVFKLSVKKCIVLCLMVTYITYKIWAISIIL